MKRKKEKFMIAGSLLLAFILCTVAVSAYAEDFRYLDSVKVVDGFYRGESGALQERADDSYKVKILPSGEVITVRENEIELKTDGKL